MIAEQFPELQSLSPDEMLTLADELTRQALAKEDESLRSLVRERLAEYRANPDAVIPWEEVRRQLRRQPQHA